MNVKTLLAVFAIVIAVGFVAANSVTPQASAQLICSGHPLDANGHTVPCVGSNAPLAVPPLRPQP